MGKEREPVLHKPYVREAVEVTIDGRRIQVRAKTGQIKSLWKKAGKPGSLKEFARSVPEGEQWLYNKACNSKRTPLKIGRTRKKKTVQGKK